MARQVLLMQRNDKEVQFQWLGCSGGLLSPYLGPPSHCNKLSYLFLNQSLVHWGLVPVGMRWQVFVFQVLSCIDGVWCTFRVTWASYYSGINEQVHLELGDFNDYFH